MDKTAVKRLACYMRWQGTPDKEQSLIKIFFSQSITALREWLYSVRAFFRKKINVSATPCDVLLLHYSETSQARGYRNTLVAKLESTGLRVIETAIHKPRRVLASRELFSPNWNFIHRYYFHAAYARWIIERYRPRIILTDKNGSVLAPFLKDFIQPYGKLVHIAHSIPTDNFRKFSMNAYDYYFLFGKSSLDRLQRRPLFGTSQAVLTGTYSDKIPVPLPAQRNTVLIVGTGPALEKTPAIQAAYATVLQTVRQMPEMQFIVKPHPRSDASLWQTNNPPSNLQIAATDEDFDTVLAKTFVAIGSFTNAAIDCALQQRPYILVSDDTQDTQLEIHRMTRLCPSVDTLIQEINAIANKPEDYKTLTQQFAEYHLSSGFTGTDTIVQQVKTLLKQGKLTNTTLLTDTFLLPENPVMETQQP
jgi:hypothetical protein